MRFIERITDAGQRRLEAVGARYLKRTDQLS
jgi:hypothetical protein